MKKIEKIIMLIILACLCVLAWASVFIWHNLHEAMKDYTHRTMKEIDKIVYNQYSNQKVKRIC